MSEGTRHFISGEWLPTMRTLPIDSEPRIFLGSSTIKRGVTLGQKAKFHAEMHSPSFRISMTKVSLFLNCRYTDSRTCTFVSVTMLDIIGMILEDSSCGIY